jgi:dolichyl-phosphate-mannose--protein O-mannosyl transferase
LAAGLALATKWTAVYLLAVLGMDFLASWVFRRRRYSLKALLAVFASLVLLPAGVYLASYAQYFRMGYDWPAFGALQKQMWMYHTGLKATHAYQSKPWQWALNLRPVWLYSRSGPDGRIADIYDLGNSVVLYLGLGAMASLAVQGLRRAQWPAAFLLAAYLVLWLPWSLSPRIMFFYHYLPAVPMLCVAGGLLLDRWLENRRRWVRLIGWTVPILAAAWFVFFFPHMTAIPVGRAWSDAAYYWIPSWR